MANNITPLEQLKGFLNQLFQFDSQDLDFGVYKILHYKRREIKNFIENLLVDKVKEELQTLSEDETKKIQEQIASLKKDSIIDGWLKADDAEKKTLEKFERDKIKENGDELNFVLANKKPDISEHEITFYFEYRPLDEKEKNKVKSNNKQDTYHYRCRGK